MIKPTDPRIQALIVEPRGGVLRLDDPVPDGATTCVLYARRSKKGGRSIKDQIGEMWEWTAEDRDWWPVAIVIEHGSASRYKGRDREYWPEVSEMIATQHARALATWENSRSTRELGGYVELRQALEDAKALWCYGDEVFDMRKAKDRQRTAQDALSSEEESDKTSRRNLRTCRMMAREGTATQGFASWGYLRSYHVADGHRFTTQYRNEELIEPIRMTARRLLSGISLKSEIRRLNAAGVLAPAGGTWKNSTQLRVAITRPALAGLRIHNGVVVGRAVWEPILDDDRDEAEKIHRRLVAHFADPSRRTAKDTKAVHLMAGLARCAVCNSPCHYKMRPDKRTKPPVLRTYYICDQGCVSRNSEMVDAVATEFVVGLLSTPDALDLFKPAENTAVDQAEVHLTELRDRLAGFYRAAATGSLSPDGLVAVEMDLQPQIVRAEKAAAKSRARHLPEVVTDIAGPQVRKRWAALSINQQRVVIRTVSETVIERSAPVPGAFGRRTAGPESVRITQRSYV